MTGSAAPRPPKTPATPGRRAARRRAGRPLAIALGITVASLVAWIAIFSGSDAAVVHARFTNASQLVQGGLVQIAGVQVGTVRSLDIAPDGTADAELAITDRRHVPLRRGTRAAIRTVGQAGVASRFVELSPGPLSAATLGDGAVIGTSDTTSLVDLDDVLNVVNPKARESLRGVVDQSSKIFAGSGAPTFNRMLAQLDPTLGETAKLFSELEADRAGIEALIRNGDAAATAIASRSPELRAAVGSTARSFGALARERADLDASLRQAPDVLRRGSRTLAGTARAVEALRPALRAAPVATPSLSATLRRLPKTLDRATPVARQLRIQLPPLRRTLQALAPLEDPVVGGLRQTSRATTAALPILKGLRYYGADVVLGIFNGLAGVAVGNYNELGHYARLEFVQNPQTLLGGSLSKLVPTLTAGSLGGVLNVRTGLTARCPGGAAPPAPDGSNPWIPDRSLCDPSHDVPESVNRP